MIAYVRMIDGWLVFCQLVPFTEVILLTAQDCYRDEEVEDNRSNLETETNKPGTGNLFQVVENCKTSKVDAFKDHNVFGDNNAYNEVPFNRKLQCLKSLGALKKSIQCHDNVVFLPLKLSEKRILPMTVFTFSFVYFGLAAAFYLI